MNKKVKWEREKDEKNVFYDEFSADNMLEVEVLIHSHTQGILEVLGFTERKFPHVW